MSKVSRRVFLASTAAIPFSLWLEKNASAKAVMTRYNALSAQGQAMLKIYAGAVKQMRGMNSGDPRSWVFQWYTHRVRGDSNKAAQLLSIYPAQSGANFNLAKAMWNTCQNHSNAPGQEQFFLPWHRMYVYFLERIVRKVSGQPTFTLPYWNYSVTGANHGVIPKQFRMQNDATFGPLFISNRNPGVNTGQAIDAGQPGNLLSTNSLAQCGYNSAGAVQGFCLALDSGLHGNVHGLTGNAQNMGSVAWAANDPVFWAHHCNIDRLWASWNKVGRKNPSDAGYLSKTFTFADEAGVQVIAKVKDFLDITTLGYTYEAFEPRQGLCLTAVNPNLRLIRRAIFPSGPIQLSSQPVRVNLEPFAAPNERNPGLRTNVRELKGDTRLYLVLRNLQADIHPGVLYHLYLELPANTPTEKGQSHFVGTIHFFDAIPHNDDERMDMTHGMTSPDKFFSFDITDLTRSLQSRQLLSDRPTLTIVPAGRPANEAKPVIGETSIVEQ